MLRKLFLPMILCGVLFSTILVSQAAGKKLPPGFFPWQFPSKNNLATWKHLSFNKKLWWGTFPHNMKIPADEFKTYPWAVGPFTKYAGNPVLAPTPGAWDQGHFSGGVHNGAIIVKGGKFYYIYRGERPRQATPGYICDIGIATSPDGIHFTKIRRKSGLFRHGKYKRYSYEDVDVARYKGTYYLFCNQWDWNKMKDYKVSGTFLATSRDLLYWKRVGIVFPNSTRLHRNGVVLQSPHNRAIRVHGKFVMYLDNGLVAYSKDMIHWVTGKKPLRYPGDECCFALTNYSPGHPNRIVLFTGGNFTGYFYAIGEVLFSKKNPAKPLAFLPAPVLTANPKIPYENGFSATDPAKAISSFDDTIFFTGLTRHKGQWWMYYGGSEYYTCLATAPFR